MTVNLPTARFVQQRAAQRCEYCLMHQSLQGATFHVEHVIPLSRGGDSETSNLAWACPSCNLSKGSATKAIDPLTAEAADLFHPRNDHWKAHFDWDADKLVGLTAKGRATIAFLQLNSERRLQIRKAERLFRFHPPPS